MNGCAKFGMNNKLRSLVCCCLPMMLTPAVAGESSPNADNEEYRKSESYTADGLVGFHDLGINIDYTSAREQNDKISPSRVPGRDAIIRTVKSQNRATLKSGDDQFTLSQVYRVGADTVASKKQIASGGLGADAAWRSEIDAVFEKNHDDVLTSQVSLGIFDTRHPIASSRGGVGLGAFERWSENGVIDGSLSISDPDNKLKFALGIASAESRFATHFTDDPALWIYEPLFRETDRRGTAFSQKLDLSLIKTENFTADVSVHYTNAGQNFRNAQSDPFAEVYFEGENINAVGRLSTGDTEFSIEKDTHRDEYFSYDENVFRFANTWMKFKGTISQELAQDDVSVYYADDIAKARVSINLAPFVGDAAAWLPDDLTLGVSQRSALQQTLFSSPGASQQSLGIGLSKGGDRYLTDLYVYKTTRTDVPDGDRAGLDQQADFGIDIIQEIFFDKWDLSLYLNMSDARRTLRLSPESIEREFSAGVSFSRDFEEFPDITIEFDAYDFSGQYLRDEYDFRNHDLSLKFEADISDAILRKWTPLGRFDQKLSMYAGAYLGWSAFEDSVDPRDAEEEARLLILLRRDR